MFSGVMGVYYREINVLKTRIMRSIVASMVSPALFLIAFGYGLGRYQQVGSISYLEFLYAGLLCMSTLNVCYGIASEINIARFYYKTFDEYLIAPISRWQIVVGEVFYGITKGFFTTVIFFIYALIANIDININAYVLTFLLMHMAIFSLLGFCVAVKVKSHSDQNIITTFIITPMTFLSGVFYPVDKGPLILQKLVQLFPITHSVALLRPALMKGELGSFYNLFMLLLFLVVLFILALFFANRTQG